jgi:hypothetical protein
MALTFRLSMIVFCCLLVGKTISASPFESVGKTSFVGPQRPRCLCAARFSAIVHRRDTENAEGAGRNPVLPKDSCERVKSEPEAWVRTKVDALVLAARTAYGNKDALPAYKRVVRGISGTIRQCKLSQDDGFVGRYREFVEYIEATSLGQRSNHELGLLVPDKEYFEETRQYVQIPEFLLSQTFLRSVSRAENLDHAKVLLRQLNSTRKPAGQLIFFSYRSQHLGTPDNGDSYRRLLIVVPGDVEKSVPEKWVQFGITDPGARPRVRNLSVVSALAGPDGTSSVYFKDFFRTYRRDGSIRVNGRWELGHGDDNCVSCHKSGILPIFPEAGSVSPSEQEALNAVNQRFLTYGPPRFGRYKDETKFGPGLSSASWDSRTKRFGSSFSQSIVARAMNCAACHQAEQLGALNWPMDETLISSYVKGGKMPLGYELKTTERSELYRNLIEEYFAIDNANPGILKAWLLGISR